MSPETAQFLERLFSSGGRGSEHEADAGRAQGTFLASLSYIEGAVDALLATGSLSADEAATWMQRARELHRREATAEPARRVAHPVKGPETYTQFAGRVDPRSSRLLRTIPGPSESRPWRGGRMRLLSIEAYEAGLVVHWQADEPPVVTEEETAEVEFHLRVWAEPFRSEHRRLRVFGLSGPLSVSAHDDVGSRYHCVATTRETDNLQRGTMNFTPGLGGDANSLVIDVDDATFDVLLK